VRERFRLRVEDLQPREVVRGVAHDQHRLALLRLVGGLHADPRDLQRDRRAAEGLGDLLQERGVLVGELRVVDEDQPRGIDDDAALLDLDLAVPGLLPERDVDGDHRLHEDHGRSDPTRVLLERQRRLGPRGGQQDGGHGGHEDARGANSRGAHRPWVRRSSGA
jgi:hypothetical protein